MQALQLNIFDTLPNTGTEDEPALNALNVYFTPKSKKNVVYEIIIFHEAQQSRNLMKM